MRPKNYAIRNDIYNELLRSSPRRLSCAEIASGLGIPLSYTHNIYYYIEDMCKTQGFPHTISKYIFKSKIKYWVINQI